MNKVVSLLIHTIPGHWIPAIPAGMTVLQGFGLTRHPGMDARNQRPWTASDEGVMNANIVDIPSLVTGFRHSLPE